MGFENEDFIHYPYKQQYYDDDDEIYFSDDNEDAVNLHNFEIVPILQLQPDMMGNADGYELDDDDEEYNPMDEEFFTESEIEYNSDYDDSIEDDEESENEESQEAEVHLDTDENKTSVQKPAQAPALNPETDTASDP